MLFVAAALVILAEMVVVAAIVGATMLGGSPEQAVVNASQPTAAAARPLPLPPSLADLDLSVWDNHGPINILLLGMDADDCARPGNQRTTLHRTDTIILVRVDPETKRAAMLSIPRDLLVLIERYGAKKINTAHLIGEMHPEDTGGGPALLKHTIEQNLRLPVHRYVRVDFAGFEQIVEALDGIDVDVPPSEDNPTVGLYDTSYPDGHCGTMTISFPPGPQHMTAEQALQYARSRYSTSDFDRSRRQMQVLKAMRDKGLSLRGVLDLPELIPAWRNTVDTDLTPREVLALLPLARSLRPEVIPTYQIDQTLVHDDRMLIDNALQAVLILHPAAFEAIKARFLALEPPAPDVVVTPTVPTD
jgi:LCP family protein required for cell wall assembly